MDKERYLDLLGLANIANYVNKKLRIVTEMPSPTSPNDIVLYKGDTSADYICGCIYLSEETGKYFAWTDFNNIYYTKSLQPKVGDIAYSDTQGTESGYTVEEYDNENLVITINSVAYERIQTEDERIYNWIIKSGIEYIKFGYLNSEDAFFYEDKLYTKEIEKNTNYIYIDIENNDIYRYDDETNKYFVISGDKIQMAELPTAAGDLEGTIYQYIGSDETTYKKGAFYECVSDGESTPTYSWEQKDVQSSGYKSISFLTMTGAKYQCITGLKLGGAYLIEIGYNMFIVRVLDNFGDQSQKKYGFEIELLGQNLSDTTNAFYNYPVYLNNFEDNALKPILAIYVSNGDRTNIRVTQISGVVNNDFDFGTFYTSTPPVPFKKSTFYSAASMREAIAPLFNDNTSYNVGDIIWKRVNTSMNSSRVHDNIELYRCIVAHSGSWSSAHFEKIQLCKDFKSGSKVFSGTMDEWDALAEAEQAKYDFIATPDEAVEDIADAVIDGDMRAITSNAVAQVVPNDANSSNKLVTENGMHGLLNANNGIVTDLNSAIKTGTYIVTATSTSVPSNYNYGILVVYGQKTDTPSSMNQWIFQEFHSTRDGAIFIRKSINSSSLTPTNWSSWQKLVTVSDIIVTANGNDSTAEGANVSSTWEITSNGSLCICYGTNTEAFNPTEANMTSMQLPSGYVFDNVISANIFMDGRTSWVTGTSHKNGNGAGTYVTASGLVNAGSFRQIVLAHKA